VFEVLSLLFLVIKSISSTKYVYLPILLHKMIMILSSGSQRRYW
jgi:hypothetical protein